MNTPVKKKECPSCAMQVDAKEKVCPFCSYEFTEHSSGIKWIGLILAVLLLLYFIL
jgi:RNA polymerase subunit RPABC4/transcription elongation factor Spt4